jgi:hypothetical protein
VVQEVQVQVEVEVEVEVEEPVNHVTRRASPTRVMKVPSIVDQSMQVHPATKGRCSVAVAVAVNKRASPRTPSRHLALALVVKLHPPVCVHCFNRRQQSLHGICL